jgi:hypothetical protein
MGLLLSGGKCRPVEVNSVTVKATCVPIWLGMAIWREIKALGDLDGIVLKFECGYLC